jgi:transketolase
VICPADAPEMTRAIEATLDWPYPVYVRFGKGGDPVISKAANGFTLGKAITMRPGREVAIISSGVMTARSLDAAAVLADAGIDASVVHVHTIKPFDAHAICEAASACDLIVTVEEHSRIGGLGSAVSDALAETGIRTPQLRLAFPDVFIGSYGSQDSVLEAAGLQPPQIALSIQQAYQQRDERARTLSSRP